MIVKLPTIQKEWDEQTNRVVVTKDELKVNIDTSFKAHQKWEEQFQNSMNCSLATYTDRVMSWKSNQDAILANFLGILKLLYCYVNSPELPTFIDFITLFEPENYKEIFEKIEIVLGEVNKTIAKN